MSKCSKASAHLNLSSENYHAGSMVVSVNLDRGHFVIVMICSR